MPFIIGKGLKSIGFQKPVFLCQLSENSMRQPKATVIRGCFTIITEIKRFT